MGPPGGELRVIAERQPGRRAGHACRRPTHCLRNKPAYTRTISISTIVKQEPSPLDAIAFSGRVCGHALKPGRYVPTYVALDKPGASSPQSLLFTVTGC